ESSVPKPVARPMTRTPTATIAAAAIRERFARLTAGAALRPGLPELGATWRAGRLPPGAARKALVPRDRGMAPFWTAGPGPGPSGTSGWVSGASGWVSDVSGWVSGASGWASDSSGWVP